MIGRAKEIETKEQADALRGLKLFVPRERFPAPDEDEVYVTDLIGLEARDPDGRVLGRIKAVQNFGASDMLEIAPGRGRPDLVPALHPRGDARAAHRRRLDPGGAPDRGGRARAGLISPRP